MKKIAALLLALGLVLSLTACEKVASFIQGDVTGEVGKVYKTQWFDFSVNSLETVAEYEGVPADEGYVFVVANITEKNTWDGNESIPMSNWDFYMLEGTDTAEINPESPWADAMMPDEFSLAPDEEVTYDVVFMVSENVADVKFVYLEVDEDGGTHATFTIVHNLAA